MIITTYKDTSNLFSVTKLTEEKMLKYLSFSVEKRGTAKD